MTTPTVHIPATPTDSTVDRNTSILDTTSFDKKLAATDNTLQELAVAFDEHTHTIAEVLSTDKINVLDTTDATTNADGSLQTAGGLSVAKKAFITETVTCAGVLPITDDTSDLGSGALRWNDIYATNATIQVSDKRLKKDIKTQDLGLDFILSLEPVQYRMLNGSRIHEGFIAQDIEAYLPRDSSMLIKSESGQYGLRYSEFISPIVLAIQELKEITDRQPKEVEVKTEVIREIVNSPKEVIREIETIKEIKEVTKEIEFKTPQSVKIALGCSIAISIVSIVLQFLH